MKDGILIDNRYWLHLGKQRLVNMMISGICYPTKLFHDARNKLLAANLDSFLNIFPVDKRTTKWFLGYLNETNITDACGGESYVKGIFQGIGGNDE